LRLLTSEGLLARRPGVGTFVARVPPASIERGIDELFSLRDAITQLGHRATTRDCTVSIEPGLPPVTGELGLPSRAEVCRVRRVRCADDQPVILCEDYFSPDLLGQQPVQLADLASEIVGAGSLYAWLDQLLGAPIDSALAHIEAANASPEQARALRLPPGTALLRMRQTHFTTDGQAVLYSDSLHNGAFMHFHLRRKRMAAVPEARERR
jgi:DNA-binding GntR family transcriptional regulator